MRFRLMIFLALMATANLPAAAQDIDFTTQIRPILSDNCFACHGPDERQRPTELRLDEKESVTADLGGYSAIVPGDPDASELIKRIETQDSDAVMPPIKHRKKLTVEQKRLLRDWIKQGGTWSTHWAFVPPKKSRLAGKTSSRENFIDTFVQQRLKKNGLSPAPPADRTTLLRRLSFDLVGLPPSPELVATFDGSEASYGELVEKLLSSPHFGERMGVFWLDLVRYADSVGYHGDQSVSVTPYRDYVVEAFNRNKPFDEFTMEQLAGDLLEQATQDQLIASGYNRLGMMSAEGGVQPEEYLAKYAADRVRTTASVWLGVTLGCAECHDHKFDPFTTKEFYEFAAFFADIKEKGLYSGASKSGAFGPQIDVPDEGRDEKLAPLDKKIADLQAAIERLAEDKARQQAWETQMLSGHSGWETIAPDKINFKHGDGIEPVIKEDGSVLVSGNKPDRNTYVIAAELPIDQPQTIRLEVIPDEQLPQQGPGHASNGNLVLTQLHLINGHHAEKTDLLDQPVNSWPQDLKKQEVTLTSAEATFEQTHGSNGHPDKKWSAQSALDRNRKGTKWGWAILPRVGATHEWVAKLQPGQIVSKKITIVLQQQHGNGSHTIGSFRLSVSTKREAQVNALLKLPKELQAAIQLDPADRNPNQVKKLREFYIQTAKHFEALNRQVASVRKQREQVRAENTRTTLVTVPVKPREMRVLARGNWMDKSGEVVTPGVPAAIWERTWKSRATRKELAEWLTDKQNPLTARVFVNRVWRMLFGSGLSNVLDDLGSQGEPPTHPELLDQLAIEFVDSGWNVKHLIRLMVTSKVYRQSSSLRDELAEADPENRLYARQSRFRLDAEFIRDNLLSVSGLLVDRIGGRNGKPYQPAGLYRHLNFPKRTYQASQDDSQYRRGLYTHWQRQFLHPAMKTFDAPSREECTAARPRSSTPLAALVMLNDPSYVEAARVLAEKVISAEQDDSARIHFLFESCLTRKPTDEEADVLAELLASHRKHFSNHAEEAKKLMAVGLAKSDSQFPVEERAAWTSVCRAVLNTHEFVLRK